MNNWRARCFKRFSVSWTALWDRTVCIKY